MNTPQEVIDRAVAAGWLIYRGREVPSSDAAALCSAVQKSSNRRWFLDSDGNLRTVDL